MCDICLKLQFMYLPLDLHTCIPQFLVPVHGQDDQ